MSIFFFRLMALFTGFRPAINRYEEIEQLKEMLTPPLTSSAYVVDVETAFTHHLNLSGPDGSIIRSFDSDWTMTDVLLWANKHGFYVLK